MTSYNPIQHKPVIFEYLAQILKRDILGILPNTLKPLFAFG
jgi:hypothetical protein